jgi:hypothetical protein
MDLTGMSPEGDPRMKRIAMVLLLAASLPVAAGECPRVPKAIEAAIAEHIEALRATEYCEARTVKSDGKLSVVIFTAEGACGGDSKEKPGTCSSTWDRFMVGERKGKIIGPDQIGGKFDFSDKKVRISGNVVEISGLTPGADDAFCCPTVPASRKYKISTDGFEQVSP